MIHNSNFQVCRFCLHANATDLSSIFDEISENVIAMNQTIQKVLKMLEIQVCDRKCKKKHSFLIFDFYNRLRPVIYFLNSSALVAVIHWYPYPTFKETHKDRSIC